jgi:hypothetical protein
MEIGLWKMNKTIDLKPIGKITLNDVAQGIYETSADIRGNWRTSWVMQLKRKRETCKLPRGFTPKSSQMTIQYV